MVRIDLHHKSSLFLALLVVALLSAGLPSFARSQSFDAQTTDVTAVRWQAMGEFYAENGLLADHFYADAAVAQAARWQATGEFYLQNGLLTDGFYTDAAVAQAARWQDMGEFYLQNDLLLASSAAKCESC